MAIFSDNKDLDSTLTVIGIHILMGGAMYFHATGKLDAGIMNQLMIAYTGVCGYLFGKGKAEADAKRQQNGG